jgi:hypothetical protein
VLEGHLGCSCDFIWEIIHNLAKNRPFVDAFFKIVENLDLVFNADASIFTETLDPVGYLSAETGWL